MKPSVSLLSLLTLLSFLYLTASQSQSSPPPAPPTLSPPPPPPASTPQSITNAIETLSNARYTAMSLTLEVLLHQPQFLNFPSPLALTIFAPPDSAFIAAGQPSLSLILLHFSPLSLSLQSLISLPYSSTIPTLSINHTQLYITTAPTKPPQISINTVKISGSPLYDDGFVVVFGIEDFFTPNFSLSSPTLDLKPTLDCVRFSTFSSLLEPSGVLKSRGCSIMAAFLDLQLVGFIGSSTFPDMKLTLFAPVDEAIVEYSGNFLQYSSLFLRHLVPCKLSWTELNGIANGTVFGEFAGGFSMKITKYNDKRVMVNGLEITTPDMYENDWIAIHGLREVIPGLDIMEEEAEEISFIEVENNVVVEHSAAPFGGEF